MDNTKYQYEGMKWLVELELLNHPQVINTIRFNILMASKHIREVELLMYRENKSMLVLLDLTWIGRKFLKTGIMAEVEDVLTQLLPSFRFRVTEDPKIMEMAVAKVKKALTGGSNESPINSNVSVGNNPIQTTNAQPDAETGNQTESGIDESSSPSKEEQSDVKNDVQPDAGGNDPQEK